MRITQSGINADIFAQWLRALEVRHLADLRVPEVTRALRALSSAYVERRGAIARGAALEGAGKRAAFALFYAPLHFLATQLVVRELRAHSPAPHDLIDLGCGTGAAGAAWALECQPQPRIMGVDRHPWAVAEAKWTYRILGLDAQARIGDVARLRPRRADVGIVAAYLLNEVGHETRQSLLQMLSDATHRGAPVLIIEPIARAVVPWWDSVTDQFISWGGRADEWRFDLDLPPMLRMLDKAAGLNHRSLKLRSLFIARSI